MKNISAWLVPGILLFTLAIMLGNRSFSQTEGFNVKTPTEKIADAASKFLEERIDESKNNPKKSIPKDLICSAECFLVIQAIEIVQSRGDFAGTGLMACRAPNSDTFTEPLFYNINHIHSFYEEGGGIVILVTDKDGMKAVLGDNVDLNNANTSAGKTGDSSQTDNKSFVAYAKPKNQDLQGYDLSGGVITYSSKDTFNAYQATIVPIEIFAEPQDVPPVLRDFDSLISKWTKSCK